MSSRQRVLARPWWQGGVKRGVEYGYVRRAREQLAQGAHGRERRRIVQGREPVERAEGRQRSIVDERGAGEALAAMHDAMYHRVELAKLAPACAKLRKQRVERRREIWRRRRADVLDAQLEAARGRITRDHRALDRGTAAVDGENSHPTYYQAGTG